MTTNTIESINSAADSLITRARAMASGEGKQIELAPGKLSDGRNTYTVDRGGYVSAGIEAGLWVEQQPEAQALVDQWMGDAATPEIEAAAKAAIDRVQTECRAFGAIVELI